VKVIYRWTFAVAFPLSLLNVMLSPSLCDTVLASKLARMKVMLELERSTRHTEALRHATSTDWTET